MLLPNKTISYNESCIYKGILILDKLSNDKTNDLVNLYKSIKNDFTDIAEFIDVLDFLFLTNKIKLQNRSIKLC